MSTVAAQPVPNTVDPRTARKVTLAGCVGIFAELYDNGIFGFMAGSLAAVFFPGSDNAVQLVFLGYAVSFFFRPSAPSSAATSATASAASACWSSSSC